MLQRVRKSKRKEIHIIADNLSAHKTKEVKQFLQQHSNVSLDYTPRILLGSTKLKFGFQSYGEPLP